MGNIISIEVCSFIGKPSTCCVESHSIMVQPTCNLVMHLFNMIDYHIQHGSTVDYIFTPMAVNLALEIALYGA